MIKPISNFVVVSEISGAEKTAGGLIIPESFRDEPNIRATVMAVGIGRYSESGTLIPPSVQAGDVVLFAKRRGMEYKHNGETYLIVPESDIVAIVVD